MLDILKKLFLAASAGLIAGALVGLVEASYLLSSSTPEEYVALFYAVVLYGVIGVGIGGACGVGVVVLDFLLKKVLKKKGVSNPFAFTLPFLGVICALGLVITLYYLNKVVYGENGVPGGAKIKVLLLYGMVGLSGLWLGPIMLIRTPFKILLRLRGTVAVYLGLLLLSGIFAFAPVDGGGPGPLTAKKDSEAVVALRKQIVELADQEGDSTAAEIKGLEAAIEQAEKAFKTQPNLLLIMVDTLRWDYIAAAGQGSGHVTPTLDALAADSVFFENAFAAASWTRSATASLFSSMVPLSHTAELKDSALPDEVDTVAEVLGKHGYYTGGLPNNINVTRSHNFDQGFDYFSFQAPEFPLKATESVFQLSMYQLVRKIREKLVPHKRVEEFYQPADAVLGNTQAFIEAQKDQRWFGFVHLMEPHDPYFERPLNGVGYGRAEHEVPDHTAKVGDEPLIDYLQRVYRDEITAMDKDLGAFFQWMKDTGIYDNTVIVITADHGEEFFEHGGWWHGTSLFEEQIHVPLIVKMPAQNHAGARVPWQVRVIDIAPTLTDLAGAPASGKWQGESLFGASFEKGLQRMKALEEAALETEVGAGSIDSENPPEVIVDDLSDLDRLVYAQENFEGYVLESVRAMGWKFIAASNPTGAGEGSDTRRVLPSRSLFDMSGPAPDEMKDQAGTGLPVQGKLEGLAREQSKKAAAEAVGAVKMQASATEEERMRALGYTE